MGDSMNIYPCPKCENNPVLIQGNICGFCVLEERQERNCVECKFYHYEQGFTGYSEYTPGWPESYSCTVGHWNNPESAINLAPACKDYVYHKDE
jgi:hypothetical protein